ncbi:MAG: hypothetical protein VX589_08525, partial [Myxococcota bacterium]|nr:hypothetical protein [Myxococcota bacterium]
VANDATRSAALMRVVSSLMEAGPLPPPVRRALSSSILGDDVYFWGKDAVQAPLVEVILALMSGIDDDTILFLQKVVVHPNIEIRKSVLRTLPLDENDHIRNMLVSHLQDAEHSVRIEVLERIGSSMDLRLASYLLNHYRQDAAKTEQEKRAVALNLARIDIDRHMPIFNAMLGRCAIREDRYIKRAKPRKDDLDYQRAGLEVLYHLNSREARRLLYNAAEKGAGPGKLYAERVWRLIKSKAYGEPTLPRSTHDPEYDAETAFNLDEALHAFEKDRIETAPPKAAEPAGLFGKIKTRIFSRSKKPEAMQPARTEQKSVSAPEVDVAEPAAPVVIEAESAAPVVDAPELPPSGQDIASSRTEGESPLSKPADAPIGPVRAGLKLEASVSADRRKWSGTLPMTFAIYDAATGGKALWSERKKAVTITAGRFEVLLGTDMARLPGLPEKIWLSIDIDGEILEPRAEVSRYRSIVQG